MLPFLLVAYFLIELIEHRHSEEIESVLKGAGRFGFIPGSLLGLIPQCGFSGMAADLYSSKVITLGTLAAVFISTSDEAVPLLIANPDNWTSLLMLLGLKLIGAFIAGFVIDFIIRPRSGFQGHIEEIDCQDHHDDESIIIATLRHTGVIILSIFAVLFFINLIVELIGSEKLSGIIGTAGVGQIFISALVGMIPNCSSSVLLTSMYTEGQLSFAAMFAGLCSGSGMGTLVLLQTQKNKRKAVMVLGLIYLFSVVYGLILWVA